MMTDSVDMISLAPQASRLMLDSASGTAYASASPYPHCVFDNFLKEDQALRAGRSFPLRSEDWTTYVHVNERKYGLSKRELIPEEILKVIDQLQSEDFVRKLSAFTGIPGLKPDYTLEGGGLHLMHPGGFLNVHSDFLTHPKLLGYVRRVNLLIFLSDDWEPDYGGELELWNSDMSTCVQRIQPSFNRCVIFDTDATSYHGCPVPLKGPAGFVRKSLALYYFTESAEQPVKRYTDYRPRPEDAHKRWAIWLDNKAVACYSWMKRKTGMSDDLISKILRRF